MATIHIDETRPLGTIAPEIYGHFSEHLGRCIYEGIFVKPDSGIPNVNGMRTDVVEALREIRVPVLRWPGGCFADEYHWKDGIGPLESRKRMVNTHWGGVVEDNSFGTHEFMELCRQLGCQPYINGNVGSGTVREMSEWMEYLTFDGVSPMAELRAQNGHPEAWKVKYFGVGNETWGCGGSMRAEYYADVFRRYQTYVRSYGDNQVCRIASGASNDDYHWTQVLMEQAAKYMDGLTMHYYVLPGVWEHKGSATEFTPAEYEITMEKAWFMDELITRHSQIMDRYDPEQRIGLIVDEWGCWFDVEPGTNPGFLYQQNTMRDAMVAALTLNIFNQHSDRVSMANLAQTVNVLQSVILTEGDRMVLTPTYHIFDLYKEHQGNRLLESSAEGGRQITLSASVNEEGTVHLTAANLSMDAPAELDCLLEGLTGRTASARILTGPPHAFNTFEAPETVKLAAFTGFALEGEHLRFTLPPCSAAAFTLPREQ